MRPAPRRAPPAARGGGVKGGQSPPWKGRDGARCALRMPGRPPVWRCAPNRGGRPRRWGAAYAAYAAEAVVADEASPPLTASRPRRLAYKTGPIRPGDPDTPGTPGLRPRDSGTPTQGLRDSDPEGRCNKSPTNTKPRP